MEPALTHPVSTAELTRVFGRIGVLSFGGPAAQIALMHRVLVDERAWLSEERFLRALSFCMLLPGPEAMQLATYAGWRLGGVRGGLIAGGLFVVPGALVVLVLAMAYGAYGALPLTQALFLGVKATVVAVVVQALVRLGRKALKGTLAWAIAGASFAALFLLDAPFPLVLALAALAGLAGGRTDAPAQTPVPAEPRAPATLRTIAFWGTLWLAPIALLWAMGATLLAQIGLFFAKLAVVTFGGAYAVLAYMTQSVVTTHGWLTTPQMLDALGLAETTPGPLILVTEFVGYLAAHQAGGWALGIAGALLTLWATFVPCFLWIFAGAPHIDRLEAMPRLTAALKGVTAAVVGVIANLSVWFAAHVLFTEVAVLTPGPLHLIAPQPASISLLALALALAAGALLRWGRLGLPAILALMASAGAVLSAL